MALGVPEAKAKQASSKTVGASVAFFLAEVSDGSHKVRIRFILRHSVYKAISLRLHAGCQWKYMRLEKRGAGSGCTGYVAFGVYYCFKVV